MERLERPFAAQTGDASVGVRVAELTQDSILGGGVMLDVGRTRDGGADDPLEAGSLTVRQ